MEFLDVVKNRTATRKFSDRQVEMSVVEKILEVGRLAPTAKNMQPQQIFVVRSADGLKKIDRVSPCRYKAPTVLLVCSDREVACNLGEFSTCVIDASIVATHIMLGATNFGVDNIWIEYFDKKQIRSEFNLAENLEPICLIPLGYATPDCPQNPAHTNRKPLSQTTKII